MGWPLAVAENVTVATLRPLPSWDQFLTLKNTRRSGFLGEMDPSFGEMLSHVALDETLKLKEFGPPAPTSTYLLGNGEN